MTAVHTSEPTRLEDAMDCLGERGSKFFMIDPRRVAHDQLDRSRSDPASELTEVEVVDFEILGQRRGGTVEEFLILDLEAPLVEGTECELLPVFWSSANGSPSGNQNTNQIHLLDCFLTSFASQAALNSFGVM